MKEAPPGMDLGKIVCHAMSLNATGDPIVSIEFPEEFQRLTIHASTAISLACTIIQAAMTAQAEAQRRRDAT